MNKHKRSHHYYTLRWATLLHAFVMSQISCDTIPDESIDPGIPLEEPYVVIELDDGRTYTGWKSPLYWWISKDYEDVVEFGLTDENGDLIAFQLSYEGDLQPPGEIHFEMNPRESLIDAIFEGEQYTTFGMPGSSRVYDIRVDLEERQFTAKFDAILHPQMLESDEPRSISGSISTHQWKISCFPSSQGDRSFSSDFCKPFREYR